MKIDEVRIGKSYLVCFPDAEPFEAEAVGKSNRAVIVEEEFGGKLNVDPRVLKEKEDECLNT